MDFDELSPDVQERARSCKASAEVKAFAREVGQELADEQIQDIAAGAHWKDKKSCKSYIPLLRTGFGHVGHLGYIKHGLLGLVKIPFRITNPPQSHSTIAGDFAWLGEASVRDGFFRILSFQHANGYKVTEISPAF